MSETLERDTLSKCPPYYESCHWQPLFYNISMIIATGLDITGKPIIDEQGIPKFNIL